MNHYTAPLIAAIRISNITAIHPVYKDQCEICKSDIAVTILVAGHTFGAAVDMTAIKPIQLDDSGCIGMFGPMGNGRIIDTYLVDKTSESEV